MADPIEKGKLAEYFKQHASNLGCAYDLDKITNIENDWWGLSVKLRSPISVGGMKLLEDICIAVPDSASTLMSQCDFQRPDEDQWMRNGRYAVVINMESNKKTSKEALILKRQYYSYLLERLEEEGISDYTYKSFYAPSPHTPNKERYILKIFFGPCKTQEDVMKCCRRVADFIHSTEDMPFEDELKRYKPVTV